MGAPRICSRCLVRLVTNRDHTRVWCPNCKRPAHPASREGARPSNAGAAVDAVHHGDEREGAQRRRRHSARHATPPPLPVPTTPPPLPEVAREASPAIPIAYPVPPIEPSPRKPRRHRNAAPIPVFLVSAAIVGGAILLTVYLAGSPAGSPAESASTEQRPASRPAVAPAWELARPTPPRPRPPQPTHEERQQQALLAVFQTDAAASPNVGVEGAREVDALVLAGLQAKAIPMAPLCSDPVFVRRVYLDVIGRIPSAEEARQFLDSKNPNRRTELIDRLLAHPDFVDYWTMRWCDLLRVKSEFPINLWPNAVQAYHRWIRAAVRENLPYDQFARALLTSSGSNFRNPPANFYRAVQKKNAPTIARAVALTFMGVRPESWTAEQWTGFEGFFSRLGYKLTGEWKEEVVFFDSTGSLAAPEGIYPDGTRAELTLDQDPREVFADWLITTSNPWFTRNIANRAWSWLLGRGIIHEPDDIRPDNPPSNPQLLAHLEQELIRANYDLRHLFRVILNSRTYQASSIPASDHADAARLFAHYPVRRLEAEVLIDILCQVTGTTEKYSSPIPEPFTYIPESHRAVSLADASITSPFLEMFGRSSRDTGLESERNNNFTAAQRLHLLNSAHVLKKIETGPGMKRLLDAGGKPEEIADRLYLTLLSRHPSEDELDVLREYRAAPAGRKVVLDMAWALINTAEFLCRH